jgi:hypothetical protein
MTACPWVLPPRGSWTTQSGDLHSQAWFWRTSHTAVCAVLFGMNVLAWPPPRSYPSWGSASSVSHPAGRLSSLGIPYHSTVGSTVCSPPSTPRNGILPHGLCSVCVGGGSSQPPHHYTGLYYPLCLRGREVYCLLLLGVRHSQEYTQVVQIQLLLLP